MMLTKLRQILAGVFVRKRSTRTEPVGSTTLEYAPTPHDTVSSSRPFQGVGYRFDGLFEALHDSVVEPYDPQLARSTLTEWKIRLAHAERVELTTAWRSTWSSTGALDADSDPEGLDADSVLLLARRWIDQITELGAERDSRSRFTWRNDEQRSYRVRGRVDPGTTVEVRSACWWIDGDVVERGVVFVEES